MATRTNHAENIDKVTFNLVAPDLKKYTADFYEAKSPDTLAEVVKLMNLSMDTVNAALRDVKKGEYRSALSTNYEEKIAEFRKVAAGAGFDAAQIDALAEAQLTKLKASGPQVPNGLSPVMVDGVHVSGKRKGRAAGTAKTA